MSTSKKTKLAWVVVTNSGLVMCVANTELRAVEYITAFAAFSNIELQYYSVLNIG